MKHLLALKLYTDFDVLQREFRKSYRAPYSEDGDRLRSFARWRDLLEETFLKFNEVTQDHEQPKILYHGINNTMPIASFSGKNYGPSSTTTDLHVARSFAGKNGMILVLKPKASQYKVLNISWVSDYPDEKEYLIFDHEVEVQAVILSSDYDQYYHYYHGVLGPNFRSMSTPIGHISYPDQKRIVRYFDHLNQLKTDSLLDLRLDSVDEMDRMSLMQWMVHVMSNESQQMSREYKQSVECNLRFLLRDVSEIRIPSEMMEKLVENETELNGVITKFISIV